MFFGVDPRVDRWINDRNEDLIAFYRALKERPEQFIEACRNIAPAQEGEPTVLSSNGIPHNKRLKDLFHAVKHDRHVDPALRYFLTNRLSYAGRVFLNPEMVDKVCFSNSRGWNVVQTTRLEEAAAYLKDARITAGDYESLLTAPGDNVFCYLDPPYVAADTEAPGKLYQFGFSHADHQHLAEVVRACQHAVCISYDDHPLVRELYEGFHIHQAAWAYCGSSLRQKKIGRELLITNYGVNVEVTPSIFEPGPLTTIPASSLAA